MQGMIYLSKLGLLSTGVVTICGERWLTGGVNDRAAL